MKEWAFLAGAIVFEVAGTTLMKISDGLTKLVPSVLLFVFYIISFALLSLAYAIWYGVGTATITAAITAIGIYYFQEPVSALKLASILLIILGVVGLNLGGGH